VADGALEMTDKATTVRVRGSETPITRPVRPDTEVGGGYYMIDVPALYAALRRAARIPSAPSGSVEVRPVMVFGDAAAVREVDRTGSRSSSE
jgi:hypothetical protein